LFTFYLMTSSHFWFNFLLQTTI